MSVAIVLPARLASTRLANKLLLDKTGKSLLEHTIERAIEVRRLYPDLFRTILIACDDSRLVTAARRAGVEGVLTDPGHKSGTDRIAEVAQGLSEEIVINLQADEPEIEPELIAQVAQLLLDAGSSGAVMSTLAAPIQDEAEWKRSSVVKVVVDSQGRALYFSRAPIPFVRDERSCQETWTWKRKDGGIERIFGLRHFGLYCFRRAFLLEYKHLPPSRLEKLEQLEQLRALEAGHVIRVGMTHRHPPGIDTPEDYEAFVARMNAKS